MPVRLAIRAEFDNLKSYGHFINGFVITPNHVHVLISFINTKQSINTVIGNGKKFMAYEIIKRLEKNNETALLEQLAGKVESKRRENKKLHEVWELSFDWKDCRSNAFVWRKLNYMPARRVIQAGTIIHAQVNG